MKENIDAWLGIEKLENVTQVQSSQNPEHKQKKHMSKKKPKQKQTHDFIGLQSINRMKDFVSIL